MKTTFGGFSLMPPENQANVRTRPDEHCSSDLESSMSSVQIEQKSYEMPPRERVHLHTFHLGSPRSLPTNPIIRRACVIVKCLCPGDLCCP